MLKDINQIRANRVFPLDKEVDKIDLEHFRQRFLVFLARTAAMLLGFI